jgi:homopolymeric O-antigen transport system ATP-binding protein
MQDSDVNVKLTDVSVSYPMSPSPWRTEQVLALERVSFELTRGDRLGLIGRNGAGKSTLLRAIAGIFPPVSGALETHGSIASIFNASLGFMPQASGYENIFLRGAILGMSIAEIRETVPYIVKFSDLGSWIYRPVMLYSSGMALRLAFAITTAVRCDILLLDEWLGAGDATFLIKARRRMQEMIDDAGILVLATHNDRMMRQVCNKLLILDGGEMAFFGDLEKGLEIYRQSSGARSEGTPVLRG